MKRPDEIRRYLFGEITDRERDAFEESVFSDDGLSYEIAEAENDLVDSYVRNELPEAERRAFEQKFLTTQRRRSKVAAAAVLAERAYGRGELRGDATAEQGFLGSLAAFFRPRSFVFAGGLAVIALLVAAGIWMVATRQPDQIAQSNNAQNAPETNVNQPGPGDPVQGGADPSGDNSGSEINDVRKPPVNNGRRANESVPQREAGRVFAVSLLPAVRSSGRQTIDVPPDAKIVSLTAVHENRTPFRAYRAELRDNSGAYVAAREIRTSPGTLERPVTLNVRADRLKPGTYELALSGVAADGQRSAIGFYEFAVAGGK